MTIQSYTDEQVLKCAKTYEGYGEPVCPAMLRSLLADRQRLQAKVEALRADAERYRWLKVHAETIESGYPVADDYDGWSWDRESVGDGWQPDLDELVDKARATPNETKEAKS